jgi:hypothetical protein
MLLERVTGIEPAYRAWEASVLPLNYTRLNDVLLKADRYFTWLSSAWQSILLELE